MPDPSPPPTPPRDPWARFARQLLRLRFVVLALLTISSVWLVSIVAGTLQVNNTSEAYLDPASAPVRALLALRKDFGMDAPLQVLVGGDVFSPEYLQRLRALQGDLETLQTTALAPTGATGAAPPGPRVADHGWEGPAAAEDDWEGAGGSELLDQVISLVNVPVTRAEAGALRVEPLLEPWPGPAELPALRARVLGDPTLVGQLVGADGRHSVVIVRPRPMTELELRPLYDAVRQVVQRHSVPGFVAQVAGLPSVNTALNRTMTADMERIFLLSILISSLIFFAMFRHPLGILGPLLVIVEAFLWALGALALTDTTLTLITAILPGFLAAVGLGDAVHMQSVYRDGRRDGLDNESAIVHALSTTGTPIFFTSLTTALGLWSFRFASMQAIQDMGTFGALGVMAAFLMSVVVLPVVLSFNRTSLLGVTPRDGGRHDRLDRALELCNALSRPTSAGNRRRRDRVLWGGVGVFLIAGVGASRLDVHHNILGWLPAHEPARSALMELNDRVGGAADVSIVLEARGERGVRDRDLLVAMERLESHILAYDDPAIEEPVVNNVTSILDPVRMANDALDERVDGPRLPETQRGVSDIFTTLEMSGAELLQRILTVDGVETLMVARVRWLDASSYGPLSEHIEAGIARHIGARARVTVTGAAFNLFEIVRRVLGDMLRSFGVAFVVITAIMAILLRDLKLGLIAMIPNLLPILMIQGLMGYASIPIDMTTLMVASVGIGIAVDDTIHFLHHFKAAHRAGAGLEASIDEAMRRCGRAMVVTSVLLVGGFAAFLGAEMINIQRFGILVGVTVIFAMLVDLVLSPALLRLFYADDAATI